MLVGMLTAAPPHPRVDDKRGAVGVKRERAAIRVLVALGLPLRAGRHDQIRLACQLGLLKNGVV